MLKTSQEIIDLSREIEEKEALHDYAGAQALLEAKSYLRSDNLTRLSATCSSGISQKLEEKSKFDRPAGAGEGRRVSKKIGAPH